MNVFFNLLYLCTPSPIEQTYFSIFMHHAGSYIALKNKLTAPFTICAQKGPVPKENWTFYVKKLISFDDKYYAIDSMNCVDAAGAIDSKAHMDFAGATDATCRADTDDATDAKVCMDVVDAIDSMCRADTVCATAPKVRGDVADAIDSTCRADADDAIVPMEYNAAVLDACFFNSFSFATSYVHSLI
jgi:hypothetical protein